MHRATVAICASRSLTDERRDGASGAPSNAAAVDEQRVPIGVVRAAHGVRGWVRMQVYGDGGDALVAGNAVTLVGEDAPERVCEIRQVTSGRKAGEARVAFVGVESREAADALRGWQVSVPASLLGPPGDDTYWSHDLIGCRMHSDEGRDIGEIAGVWETGASDVLVVRGADEREHLVPAAFLRDVDLAERRVVVELVPGLIEED